jgi:hypothetical protein
MSFTVSIAGTVLQGSPSVVTFTPSGVTTDVVTPSDGEGGTFSPATLTFTASSAAQTTEWTPSDTGTLTVTGTSTGGATFTSASAVSYGIALDAYLTQFGKTLALVCHTQLPAGNGNPAGAIITATTGAPTLFVNGTQVQLGPEVTIGRSLAIFALYLVECGSVQSLAMESNGTSSYTTPQFTWNGDGGGTGLVLANDGVGTTASGVLICTIEDAGSGYTTSFIIPIANAASSANSLAAGAMLYVTVTNNVVTAVAPVCGGPMGSGVGYTGTTLNGVSLPGSGAFSGVTGVWQNTPVAGSGLTVNCVIGNYPIPPLVTDPGTDFVSPPSFAITDTGGSGTGATCVPVMTGPAPTDVLTVTAPAGLFTCTVPAPSVPPATNGGPSPPLTNAPVTNFAGQLEGPVGHAPGFTGQPTMQFGAQIQISPTAFFSNVYLTAKNKLKGADPWQMGFNCTAVALDPATYYPAFWTPNSWVISVVYGFGTSGPQAEYTGQWGFQYDDDFYGGVGSQTHPAFCNISNTAFGEGGEGTTWVPVNGPFTTLPTVGAVTVVSGAITAIAIANGGSGLQGVLVTITDTNGGQAAYVGVVTGGVLTSLVQLSGGESYSSSPTVTLTPVTVSGGAVTLLYEGQYNTPNRGDLFTLTFNIVSGSDGAQHVHNPFLFAPNNTIDRSNPYATDDNVVRARTANGNGPGIQRYMNVLGGPNVWNIADASDIWPGTLYSWDYYPSFSSATFNAIPNQATFTGTIAANSTSVTNVSNTSILTSGSLITGTGIQGGNQLGNVTTITGIDTDTSTITLSLPALASGTATLSQNPTPSGTAAFNFARPYFTNPAQTGLSWTPSANIYSSNNFFNSGTDDFGQFLNITNGPLGVNDNGSFVLGGVNDNSLGLVEFRTTNPNGHGLKTGIDAQTGVWTSQFTFSVTTTSGSTTVAVPGGNGGVQFVPGQHVSGSGIPSGTTIASVQSPTSITLSAAATASATISMQATTVITWNTAGTKQFTSAVEVFWVTGPDTVVAIVNFFTASGGDTQFPVAAVGDTTPATAEIPIFLKYEVFAPKLVYPYEYVFSECATFRCPCHLNFPILCSDATIQKVAQLAFQYNPNGMYFCERGNEHWNSANSQEINIENAIANGVLYYPSGTSLLPHFTPSGTTESYTTTGHGMVGGQNGAYAAMAANQHLVFTNAFVAAGGNASQVKLIYGGQDGEVTVNGDVVSAAVSMNLPQDLFCVAPYVNLGGFAVLEGASLPAGYAGGGSPGNWPVDAINDFNKHYVFYGTDIQSNALGLAGNLAGTAIQPMAYEGALSSLMASGPFSGILAEDMFNHESFRYLIRCYLLGQQRGHPNVANSGLVYFNYFCDYWNTYNSSFTWRLGYSPAQPLGSSLSNQFVTPQGGAPGNGNPHAFIQTNVSPGLTALQDWIGAMLPSSFVYDSDKSSPHDTQLLSSITSVSIFTHDSSTGIESQIITTIGPINVHASDSASGLESQIITITTFVSIFTHDSGSGIESQVVESASSLFFGPVSGITGQALVYTVIPPSNYSGTVIPSASIAGGKFIPQFLAWNNSSLVQTFIFAPEQPGTYIISLFSNPNISLLNTPITVMINPLPAQSAILTGPQLTQALGAVKVQIGVPSQVFTVTPNGPYTGIITPSDSNLTLFSLNTGTFNPPFLTFNNSSVPQTFTYTATTMGYKQISISTNPFITVSIPILVDALPQ